MDIKTLCLGILTMDDMTGYEIKKHFEMSFAHFFAAGYGSIYPALSALTDQNLVTCANISQEKRPNKKVYSITPAGRSTLLETLLSTPPIHRVRSEFLTLLYFASLMPVDRVGDILAERIANIEALINMLNEYVERDCKAPGHHFVIGVARASLEAQMRYIRDNQESFLRSLQTMPDADKTTAVSVA